MHSSLSLDSVLILSLSELSAPRICENVTHLLIVYLNYSTCDKTSFVYT